MINEKEKLLCRKRMYELQKHYDSLVSQMKDMIPNEMRRDYEKFENSWNVLFNEECDYFINLMEEEKREEER